MHELQTIDQAVSVGNLETYTHWTQQVPMLSQEEEMALAKRWYEQQDVSAARRLVMAHLRFVVKIARGYQGYGLPTADLVQEGNIGLMKEVKRFNPTVGVRLVSFAIHWIKAEIHEYVIRNWRIVKVATTKAQRKLFFNLRKYKKHLGWLTQDDVKMVSQELGVTDKQVVEMEQRLHAHDTAFDAPADDNDELTFAPAQYLEDHSTDPANLVEAADSSDDSSSKLAEALQTLDQRSRMIIEARWLGDKKVTLQKLAEKLGISLERVRQIEAQAMKSMRELIAA